MSFVQTGYKVFSKLEEIFKRKSFKTIFIAFSSLILFFGVMNVYAQEAETEVPKVKVNWDGTKAFYNLASGTDKDEDNMTSFSGVSATNTAWTILSTMAPGLTDGGDKIEGDSSIPEDMRGGLLGTADSFVNYAYSNQPNINLVAHLGNEWVPGYKESSTGLYAAEKQSGYQELMDSGISNIWAKFRDLAYLFFVVVMIVIGFMIMFRSKLGGQTLVSLGNTIPNVIVGLILVTFSFAIAGLVIDVGGLITSFLASLFDGELVSIENIGNLMKSVFTSGTIETSSIVAGSGAGSIALGAGLGSLAAAIGGSAVLAILGPALIGVGLIGLLLVLTLLGIVFVGVIKLLITLYKAYFGILLGVALGPLQIMIGSIPGQNHMTKNWFLGIVRNVLVFPVVFFIVNAPNLLLGDKDIILNFPEKLTYADPSSNGIDINATSGFLMFILRVFVIYLAAQAPKYIEAFIPNTSSKAAGDAGAAAKMSLSKIPLVGALFK
ncbi:MAG: hypothetical protein UR73_C0017G0005 [candidate division WS6 bacterium GW2011_GWF1_35_23]|uniref:Uncharacterized protein n=1 Tax=candidate division WS6 bacterium GW2011_GWF1_35_23 TaxID=1619097 RepID=A0A0G0EQY4_9BACT|nr:MAG: hypothetical protein UR73_C0017G0005 [candidate division WS6 bacterium GW2011_GWF1_35_23]